MKKGQITVFIILGILFIMIIGFLFYTKAGFVKKVSTTPSLATDYVNSCLNTVATEGIYLAAAQGGYLNPKGDAKYGEEGDGLPQHYYLGNNVLPYVLNGQEIRMRRLNVIPLLNNYVSAELPKCLNWSAFADYRVTMDEAKISIIPREADVTVSANYQIKFTGKDAFTVDTFYTTIPVRLKFVEETAHKLVNNIASAHANSSAYNLFLHCEEYKAPDSLINIYTTWNQYAQDHAISLVDAQPVKYGLPPLRYQFAIRNVAFGGMCVG